MKAMIKRRSAIEPTIGHMKTEGRLACNPLKGALGDALHAVQCGAGHNIRLMLKRLQILPVVSYFELFSVDYLGILYMYNKSTDEDY